MHIYSERNLQSPEQIAPSNTKKAIEELKNLIDENYGTKSIKKVYSEKKLAPHEKAAIELSQSRRLNNSSRRNIQISEDSGVLDELMTLKVRIFSQILYHFDA